VVMAIVALARLRLVPLGWAWPRRSQAVRRCLVTRPWSARRVQVAHQAVVAYLADYHDGPTASPGVVLGYGAPTDLELRDAQAILCGLLDSAWSENR